MIPDWISTVLVPVVGGLIGLAATVVGFAVRQQLQFISESLGALGKGVQNVASEVESLKRERIDHAVTQQRLNTLEIEVRELRAKVDALQAQLLRGAAG